MRARAWLVFFSVCLAWEHGGWTADAPALVEAPARFKNAPPPKAGSPRAAAPGAWWTIFRDRTLDGLEQQAVQANQDLAQSVARIDEARQQARAAAADFFPHLDSNLRAERQRTTNTGPILRAQLAGNAGAFGALLGGSGSSGPPAFASRALSETYNDFQAPLTLSYELDVFGRVRHEYASQRATLQAAEADRRAVELSLTGEVAANYFLLRALDSQTAVLRRTVSLRQSAVHLTQERVSAGVSGPLDLARARVVLDETQADLTDALRQRAETENSLAALCGQPASDFRLPADPLEDVAPPPVPSGIPSDLLARRPDLAEAERQVAAASDQIGASRARMLPTFNIEASAGFESGSDEELFKSESRALSVLGTIHIPIFEGGRNAADLQAAKARRDQALDHYRSTAITAFREVETALSDLKERASQSVARRQAIADANDVFDLSQKRYLEGAIDYFDVVDAQRSLLSAELSNVQTLDARFAATIALIRATGGGL
jgi:multidrug efflux system outer membrane protein